VIVRSLLRAAALVGVTENDGSRAITMKPTAFDSSGRTPSDTAMGSPLCTTRWAEAASRNSWAGTTAGNNVSLTNCVERHVAPEPRHTAQLLRLPHARGPSNPDPLMVTIRSGLKAKVWSGETDLTLSPEAGEGDADGGGGGGGGVTTDSAPQPNATVP